MGNFLVIVAPEAAQAEANELFRRGLQCAQRIRGQAPGDVIETAWARAAIFARQNGTGVSIAQDAATGSWLLAVGTWFHTDGYATGAEMRLLARALEVGAERLAGELEGFFVIVFGDGRTREVSVITDLIGSRHCFVRTFESGVALSASSLLLAALREATLDKVGCEEFLRTGVIYEDRTFFREVRKLAAASVFRFAGGKLAATHRYWRLAELEPDKFSGAAAVNELSTQLINAARRVSQVFAQPICDLTGGYDSRAMVVAFLTAGVDFATTVAGASADADVIIAQGLAELIGKPHWHLKNEAPTSLAPLKQALPLTDGECDLVDYARIRTLHQQLARRADISINGSFGEVARGYWWELLWPRIGGHEKLDAHKLAERRYAVEPSSPQLFPVGARLDLVKHLTGVIERANAELVGWPNTAQMDNAYLRLRMQRWQGRLASSTDQIWPCLSPFMLRSVLETMLQTDARERQRSLLVRRVIFALQPKLAAYPLEHGHPALPLAWRTWPRFVPALPIYAWKIGKKAAHKFGLHTLVASDLSAHSTFRSPRCDDGELVGTLDPATMRAGELIGSERLRAFFDKSQQSHFPFVSQWQRLLSLELALRCVNSLGPGAR